MYWGAKFLQIRNIRKPNISQSAQISSAWRYVGKAAVLAL